MGLEQLILAVCALVLTAAVRALSNRRVIALQAKADDERDSARARIDELLVELDRRCETIADLEKRNQRLACQLARHGISEACAHTAPAVDKEED